MIFDLLIVGLFIFDSNCIAITIHNIDNKWNNYKTKFNLSFNQTEDLDRKLIFQNNLNFIRNHNSKNSDLVLAMNNFGHLVINNIIEYWGNTAFLF